MLCFLCIGANISGYEVISSRTIVSPGCEGGVIKQKTHTFSLFNGGDSGKITASTKAKAYTSNGNRGEVVRLYSSHSYSILNNTGIRQYVKIEMKLSSHDGKYTSSEQILWMKPYEAIDDSTDLFFSKEYLDPGRYELYAQTIISGSVTSMASDSKIVNIR